MGVKKLIVERIRQQTLKVSPLNNNNQRSRAKRNSEINLI